MTLVDTLIVSLCVWVFRCLCGISRPVLMIEVAGVHDSTSKCIVFQFPTDFIAFGPVTTRRRCNSKNVRGSKHTEQTLRHKSAHAILNYLNGTNCSRACTATAIVQRERRQQIKITQIHIWSVCVATTREGVIKFD